MDEETRQILVGLGWREIIGRNDQGPYIAFIKGLDFFHVVLDSKRRIYDTKIEYEPNQFAKTITTEKRA